MEHLPLGKEIIKSFCNLCFLTLAVLGLFTNILVLLASDLWWVVISHLLEGIAMGLALANELGVEDLKVRCFTVSISCHGSQPSPRQELLCHPRAWSEDDRGVEWSFLLAVCIMNREYIFI